MGWVKEPVHNAGKICEEIISKLGKWNGVPKGNASAYEFFSDYIKDNYDVTLAQCEGICQTLKDYYKIEKFYYND